MKNGDKPAFIETNTTVNNDHMATGLTKREYFAAMAMQGYIAAGGTHGMPDIENIVQRALNTADELLNQLEQ